MLLDRFSLYGKLIDDKNTVEMQGALKGYLESGEYRVGDYRGIGDAGFVLLGNIDSDLMNTVLNMFEDLPEIFHESALLDRFHGFIKGWEVPKMKESLKANGWALNTEYSFILMLFSVWDISRSM